MIECVKENIYYKKRKKRFKKKRFFSLLITLLVVFCFFLYYKFFVYNKLVDISCDYAYSYSTESVNKAVLLSLDNDISYTDLVKIEKNQSGDIILMSTDSYKVNLINRKVAQSTSTLLKEKIEKGVPIPFFAFTGIGLFSGYGKPIYLKTLAVTSVICDFDSDFQGVGINQTLHSVYVKVKSTVAVELPLNSKRIDLETKVLINETVLLGKVPEIYLNGNLFG